MAKKYIPTEYAKYNPIRIVVICKEGEKELKEWVSLGRDVKINPKKPRQPYIVYEATEDQYRHS